MRAQQTAPDPRQDFRVRPEPTPPRSFAGLYLASWLVLAALAAGYITVLLLQPDWAPPLTTQALRSEPAPPPVPPVVQQLSTEVGNLRKTVADLQRELSYVKTTAALQQETGPSLRPASPEPELASHEPQLPMQMAAADPEPQSAEAMPRAVEIPLPKPKRAVAAARTDGGDGPSAATAKATPTAAAGRTSPSATATETAERSRREQSKADPEPLSERVIARKKVVVLNATPADKPPREPAPLETGSLPPVESLAITFGPPIVTPAPEAVAIHLDAGPSLQALKLRWSVLHDRHYSALRELEPRYLISGTAQSPSYQLLAGPVASPEEASRICALLRARQVPCSVGGPFVGQAL